MPGTVGAVTYQSFYRRFRPQRFADMVGQEHVSDTLRNAVRTDRVAHAYLFCGPRGCGKTTSARILAKALNCTDLQDGEPCGACDSCLQVAAGTSMDIIEMDAASNNGVDAMRDLVSRAALGTAGRRKVYILDEVHMLSTAASNTLLKTLEEPPAHVVFVLATTDPQKVLPTIRSRTQVFEFRLFAMDALTGLLRDVAEKAGLELDDATLAAVAKRGNGSARDALSALDSVAASGGVTDTFDITELASAIGRRDVAGLLTAVDRAAERGRDPRQLARDLVEVMRDVFLTHMGVPRPNASDELVRALSPAASTRALEVLGETLVAQRDAIEPRVVLETALVRLANPDLDASPAAIIERLDRLERLVRAGVVPLSGAADPSLSSDASGRTRGASGATAVPIPAPTADPRGHAGSVPGAAQAPAPATVPSLPADPSGHTGGGLGATAVPTPAQAPDPISLSDPIGGSGVVPHETAVTSPTQAPDPISPSDPIGSTGAVTESTPDERPDHASVAPPAAPLNTMPSLATPAPIESAASRRSGVADSARARLQASPANRGAPARPAAAPPKPVFSAATAAPVAAAPLDERERILNGLKGKARAMFSAGRFTTTGPSELEIALPNAMHLGRCEEFTADVSAVVSALRSTPTAVHLVVDPTAAPPVAEAPDDAGGVLANRRFAVPAPPVSAPENAPPAAISEDHEVDLNELVDAGDSASTALDHIARTFPGAELITEP